MGLILPASLLPLQHFGSDYLGIAPKSHIVSLKVLDASGNGVQSAFLQGLDWIHEHHRSYQIRIVNISIGSPSSEDSSASKELLKHVNALWMMVLLFVLPVETMVQNHTVFQFLVIVQKSSLLVPAMIISNDRKKTLLSGYSGRGPTTSCVMKPDVVPLEQIFFRVP